MAALDRYLYSSDGRELMQIDWHKVADALHEEAEEAHKGANLCKSNDVIRSLFYSRAALLNSLSRSIRAGIVKEVSITSDIFK